MEPKSGYGVASYTKIVANRVLFVLLMYIKIIKYGGCLVE